MIEMKQETIYFINHNSDSPTDHVTFLIIIFLSLLHFRLAGASVGTVDVRSITESVREVCLISYLLKLHSALDIELYLLSLIILRFGLIYFSCSLIYFL